MLLAASGLALNHTSALGLDSAFVTSQWLLDWYGVTVPEPGPSFQVAGRRVSLIAGRLYLDEQAVPIDLPELIGAVEVEGLLGVASSSELVILTRAGAVSERWPVEPDVSGPIQAIAGTEHGVVLQTPTGVYLFDFATADFAAAPFAGTYVWAEPSAPDTIFLDTLDQSFRGNVLTLERVLADLHSGRLLGMAGVVVMDLAAVVLLLLAVSGFIMWLRR